MYPAIPGGAPVAFYAIEGGGHAMPSHKRALPDTFLVRLMIGNGCRDVEGADVAWDFFTRQGKAAG